MNPTKNPLPNTRPNAHWGHKASNHVKLNYDLNPDMSFKASALAEVLNLLGGQHIFKHITIGTARILVSEPFLNLHSEDNRYSIPLIRNVVEELEPRSGDKAYSPTVLDVKSSDYWIGKITRGLLDGDGKFDIRPKSLEQFYNSWLDILKNVLDRTKTSKDSFFEKHRKSLENLAFKASEDVYKKIDSALEDVIGFPALMCLLGGMMTFTKDSTINSYQIDFLQHGYREQSKLYNGFVGRGLHDQRKGDLHSEYLQQSVDTKTYDITYSRRAYYHASIFLFGSKRGDRVLKPSTSYLKDQYFSRAYLKSTADYKLALEKFLYRSFSKYIKVDGNGQNKIVNGKILNGLGDTFDFLARKLETALEKRGLLPLLSLFMNELQRRLIAPNSVLKYTLRNILFTGISKGIAIKVGDKQINFEIKYSELRDFLTPDMLTSLVSQVSDFDLVWNGLSSKVKEAQSVLVKMLNDVSGAGNLEVEFFYKSQEGIKQESSITKKSDFIQTAFSRDKLTIDLSNQEDVNIKAYSMLFWMIMEPNMFTAVKLPSDDNYIFMDIFGLYNDDYVGGGVDGGFPANSIANYEENADKFGQIFTHKDIRYFVGFNNHQWDQNHNNIISYTMEKFIDFYKLFLQGQKDSKISDLR
jgi:hypothetical protein